MCIRDRLTALPELLREFNDFRMVAYSLLLVVVMIFKPSGLMGHYELSVGDILDKLYNKVLGSKKAEITDSENGGEEV